MSQVDVVIPCYRYGRFLEQAVSSVLEQAVHVRILIIDDCSPDDSGDVAEAIAARDSRVEVRRHRVNAGHIATFNEGIDWAAGDYFLLMSADDYLLPGALARATAMLDARCDVGFVFGNALKLDDSGRTHPIRPLQGRRPVLGDTVFQSREFFDISKASNIVSTPTAVVRTSLQKQIGGYRADLPHSADMAMWWRFAAIANVGFVEADQAVYRLHGANMSTTYEVGHRLPDLVQRRDALRHALNSPDAPAIVDTGLRQNVAQALSLDAVSCASIAINSGDLKAAEQLLRFAREEWPGVSTSWPWVKVALKRTMGPRAWAFAARWRSSA